LSGAIASCFDDDDDDDEGCHGDEVCFMPYFQHQQGIQVSDLAACQCLDAADVLEESTPQHALQYHFFEFCFLDASSYVGSVSQM